MAGKEGSPRTSINFDSQEPYLKDFYRLYEKHFEEFSLLGQAKDSRQAQNELLGKLEKEGIFDLFEQSDSAGVRSLDIRARVGTYFIDHPYSTKDWKKILGQSMKFFEFAHGEKPAQIHENKNLSPQRTALIELGDLFVKNFEGFNNLRSGKIEDRESLFMDVGKKVDELIERLKTLGVAENEVRAELNSRFVDRSDVTKKERKSIIESSMDFLRSVLQDQKPQ